MGYVLGYSWDKRILFPENHVQDTTWIHTGYRTDTEPNVAIWKHVNTSRIHIRIHVGIHVSYFPRSMYRILPAYIQDTGQKPRYM